MKKIIYTVCILLFSIIAAHIFNMAIVEKLILGDTCEYDTIGNETGKLFDLFYNISSNTGYHPEPSAFNFYFTTFIGLLIGSTLSYKYIWKR